MSVVLRERNMCIRDVVPLAGRVVSQGVVWEVVSLVAGESGCVWVCVCACVGVCVSVCVFVRVRERERVRVSVCVCSSARGSFSLSVIVISAPPGHA